LPNTFFQPQASQCTGGQVLYRVNAGGAALSDPRLGAVWSTDTTFRNTGTVGSYGYTVPVDSTVPACTDPRIFSTELYDRSTLPELHYGFPVTAGRSVIVRMYFADRATSTQLIGQRVFNVRIDGKPVLTNFDIDATAGHVDGLAAGHGLGTMQQFTIASDGVVDIDFSHITDNPMINGIEILDATANPPGPMPGTGVLQQRGVDSGGVPTGPATTANSTVDWSTVRGAFMVNGVLYYGLYNGSLKQRTFDPSTGAAGTETAVNLFDAPSGERIPFAIAACSGMFYDPSLHRLYYTVSGDKNLYYRYFTPESQAVGAMTFTANSAGVDFSTAAGLTLAGGKVFYGSTGDGALRSVGYAGGAVTAGTPTVVSSDGTWGTSRAIFAPNS